MTPLSNSQKSVLAQLARKAWKHLAKQAEARGEAFDSGTEAHNAFRREEVHRACGKYGLTAAANSDYCRIAGHFEDLAGNSGRAFNHLMREQSEGLRQVRVVLRRALAVGDLPENYADAISISVWGCPVEDLTESQAWKIVYTVTNRIRARQRKESGVAA